MMFLMNTISADVEPVPGKDGWYQLTGKNITRESCDCAEELDAYEDGGHLILGAQLFGVSDFDTVSRHDPRFNHENDEGDRTFGVFTDFQGQLRMMLAVNRAEYALFTFLAKHECPGDDTDISEFRADEQAKQYVKEAPAREAYAEWKKGQEANKAAAEKAAKKKSTKPKAKTKAKA